MRWLLDVLYGFGILLASPWLIHRAIRTGRYRDGWRAKFLGAVPRRSGKEPTIWVHAVSVGEVRVAETFIKAMRHRWPYLSINVTTTTRTGYQLAQRIFPEHLVSYAPLDFSWAVARILRRWHPIMLVLIELELWPNLVTMTDQQGIPIAVVNGRLSDKSWRGYQRFRYFVARWLSAIRLLAVQNQTYAARFRSLGADPNRICITGSIKFDGAEADRGNATTSRLREQLGLQSSHRVFLAGSTQAPEEAMALSIFQRLAKDFPALRLILVPRHPERFDEVESILVNANVPYTRWTRFVTSQATGESPSQVERIVLVDQVGELRYWWGLADVAFVGGSIAERGGQNMIEPAAYGVPVCFGPNIQNFSDIADLLLDANASVMVHDEREWERFVRQMIGLPIRAAALGHAAAGIVRAHQGACQRTLNALEPWLRTGPRIPPPHHTSIPQKSNRLTGH